jgi:solute carrier family 29 (equilibrative nucleoside transporter) protein 4
MFLHRYVVARVIWAYMLSIAVTYSVTLCLFPGLESEIRNDALGEWFPILIMATFNMSDFVGKVRLQTRRFLGYRGEAQRGSVATLYDP